MKLTREKLGALFCCLSLLFLYTTFVCAQDIQKIQDRMKERKPTIDNMKNKGEIGEGSDGYLHILQKSADTKTVNEENADRRTANAMLAKKAGSSVEQISKTFALKMRNVASPGHWVQQEDGAWEQK